MHLNYCSDSHTKIICKKIILKIKNLRYVKYHHVSSNTAQEIFLKKKKKVFLANLKPIKYICILHPGYSIIKFLLCKQHFFYIQKYIYGIVSIIKYKN